MIASFIVRAYNSEATIARALESALAQDFSEPYEIVVVDDGSKDNTASTVGRFSDKRIRLIQQENRGAAGAAKTGIIASKGTYIILLDADDEVTPTALGTAVRTLSGGIFDYAYGDYIEEYQGLKKRVVATDPFKVPAGALIWCRDRIHEAGGFEAETVFPEYEMLLRMWDRWKGTHIPQPLFIYHRRDSSITGDKKLISRTIELLRRRFPARGREIDMIRSYDPLAV